MVKLTPPMGWNSWNTFGANISEELIFEIADRMVEDGYLDAGYEYVVIDDCWSLRERDANGRLVPDPKKFPHGMKYVAAYIHSKGLKFGMYSCAGILTCAGYPGRMDHEFIDAATFAEWEVDLLKYDYCFNSRIIAGEYLYRRMGLALENCGRDILLSCCTWGVDQTHEWVKTTASSMWRSTTDIFDNWDSIKNLIKVQEPIHAYNGVGCFNDMDMLIVGMNGEGNVGLGGCTYDQYKLHFSAWCFFGSPLMIGCDIRKISEAERNILLNKELIKICQDPACRQPFRMRPLLTTEDDYVYAKFLSDGDIILAMFNVNEEKEGGIRMTIDELSLPMTTGKTLKMINLWTGEEEEIVKNAAINRCVPPCGCLIYRCKVVDIQ